MLGCGLCLILVVGEGGGQRGTPAVLHILYNKGAKSDNPHLHVIFLTPHTTAS